MGEGAPIEGIMKQLDAEKLKFSTSGVKTITQNIIKRNTLTKLPRAMTAVEAATQGQQQQQPEQAQQAAGGDKTGAEDTPAKVGPAIPKDGLHSTEI